LTKEIIMKSLPYMAFGLVFGATSAHAIDACMVGVWEADGSDIAQVMAVQMGGNAEYLGGTVSLEITDTGTMTLLANDLVLGVTVPDTPAIEVTVAGYSQGAMNADDGTNYVANAPEYSLMGSANVMGMRMDIPVTSADGGVWGQSTGTYGCTSNSMSFEATALGSIPRSWRRVR
jgi:hypothetical protein